MTGQQNPRQLEPRSDAICECGHPISEHAESGWGENSVCVEPMAKPDEGWWGVCPCVRRGHEAEEPPPCYSGDEPLGTCVVHGDYWTDDCTRCGR